MLIETVWCICLSIHTVTSNCKRLVYLFIYQNVSKLGTKENKYCMATILHGHSDVDMDTTCQCTTNSKTCIRKCVST